jgi:hypothetical protein
MTNKMSSDLAELLEQRDELFVALNDLLDMIAYDNLIPETVSYMVQARAAIARVKE